MIPGEITSPTRLRSRNPGLETRRLAVANTGDRPIQVGSHFHFYEVNTALLFRPRGSARFPPEHPRRHRRALRAGRHARGGNRRPGGRAGSVRTQRKGQRQTMSLHLSRRQYAEMFGPTVGDRVRLADTELFIEVERDLIAEGGGYGNEVKFGGGKVIRDGMGQSPTATRRRIARPRHHQRADPRRRAGRHQGGHRDQSTGASRASATRAIRASRAASRPA